MTLAAGIYRKPSSLLLLILLQLMLLRNPYVRTVIDGYTGWMLLLFLVMPNGEGHSFSKRKDETQVLQSNFWWATSIVLGISYASSAWSKLQTLEWRSGVAIEKILELPFLRQWLLLRDFPAPILEILTYSVILIEALFLPAIFFKRTQATAQITLIAFHLVIMLVLDFERIPLFMIMLHFLLLQR
jgi:hypothetical protein